MLKIIFFLCITMLFYSYVGYPMILLIGSLFINKKINKGDFQPEVTIIIPVHNEEKLIGKKIENCLALDYPPEKLKVIVVSDYSNDKTKEIVESYHHDQIKFIATLERVGKVTAQNFAAKYASSEIIVFTDVAITTHSDSIKLIVKNFNDKKIGAVSCKDYIEDGQANGEGYYIKYDMLVRKLCSKTNTLIGVTGGFYAIRKELANEDWNPAFPPDFYIALKCIKHNLIVIEDPEVKAYYKTTIIGWDEFQRKVRTLNRGMQALFSNADLLNIFKYKLSAIQLISHKLFRWLMPFFFIAIFISNAFLIKNSVSYLILFIFQLEFYSIVILANFIKGSKCIVITIASYFKITNLALLKAWYEFIIGKKYILWEPTKR